MVQMSLRFRPKQGQQDLAWLAQTTSDLTQIYDFLLRIQLAADVADETTRRLTENELKVAVDGRALQVGTPLVQACEGSMILQLSQYLDNTVGVQILIMFGLLLKKGPEIAALPNKVRKRWYASAEDALHARNAYERLKQESVISVMEPPVSRGEVIEESPRAFPEDASPQETAVSWTVTDQEPSRAGRPEARRPREEPKVPDPPRRSRSVDFGPSPEKPS